jgi:hypothetical protein
MKEDSALFLVRIWPHRPGFQATVRLASDERTHQFHEPAALALHLSHLAESVAPLMAVCVEPLESRSPSPGEPQS